VQRRFSFERGEHVSETGVDQMLDCAPSLVERNDGNCRCLGGGNGRMTRCEVAVAAII